MALVEVDNRSTVPVEPAPLVAQAGFVLDRLGLHAGVELAISLVGPAEITALHERWMQLPGPTDVLSFPMDELRAPQPGQVAEPGMLGDVVICPQVAAEQGELAGHGLTGELELLLTHGILHLLGHDHQEPEEHAVMFALQDNLLAAWRERR
ncbi:MAG: rRNA maturation RNase YbeY [Candidatus Nanopelagicales bacterium]